MIKPIGHYSLERPTSVYDEEALTALQLSARTAGKVNEAVRAFNALEADTNEHLENQDNRLTRMEEEQIPNTVREEIDLDIESGRFDQAISDYADDLGGRVDNLLSKVVEGSTTMDAEVIDARTNSAGVQLPNAGTAVRDSYTALAKRMDNTSVYSLDLVKQTLASQEVFTGDIEYRVDNTNYNATWRHVSKMVTLEPGNYTLVVDSLHLAPELTQYGLQVKQDRLSNGVSESHNILRDVMAPGVYPFTVRTGDGFTQICALVLQISGAQRVSHGHYYARGIHIYKGYIQGKQGLPDSFTGVDKCVQKKPGKNLFNPAEAIHGYYLMSNGKATQESEEYPGQAHSGYIPVEAGKTYTCTPATFNGTGGFHAFYTERDEATVIEGTELDKYILRETDGVITVPEGARYFRFSYKVGDEATIMVEEGNVRTPYAPYTDLAQLEEVTERVTALEAINSTAVKRNRIDRAERKNMRMGEVLTLNTCDFMNGETVTVAITKEHPTFDLGGIIIQLGDGGDTYRGITLNITDFITVQDWKGNEGEIGADVECTKLLFTFTCQNGSMYIHYWTEAGFDVFSVDCGGFPGKIAVMNNNDDISTMDCVITAHSAGNDFKTWFFGDSYFDYWCRDIDGDLMNDGFGVTNVLFDSYSGRTSTKALESLKKRLAKATPERIVWCMGMNDEDPDAETVNANWLSAFKSMQELCKANNIELIVSTIPTTTERENSAKNGVIRASGLRIVDVDLFFNTHDYNEPISSDGVHPNDQGIGIIRHLMLTTIPEMRE